MDMLERQKAMWSAGDFPSIAQTIEDASVVAVDAVGVAAGERLLDVATGTGNAALIAARAGADVTGLDLVGSLLDVARERAAAAGLAIAFVEGNAQELPFADATFDRVTSVFGAMFAPDHAATAAELVRVVRPGGDVAVCAWTPAGLNGRLFATMAPYLPPPPAGVQPPILWGDEAHVRALFAGCAVRVEHRALVLEGDSLEAWLAYGEEALGPIVLARRALEPEGRWEALRADLAALYGAANEATDGSFRARADYLLAVARRPA